MVNLKKNIVCNYVSQIYVTIIGIVLLPMYIKYMGSEAYGLIGFFAMLQVWFNVLDLGLTPTIARETARYRAGALSKLEFSQLYRALSMIFLSIAVVGGGVLFLLSESVATKWLNIESLSISDVIIAVQVMAISVALRWITGLYRGVVSGSEELVWLSGFNVIVATLRFVGVFFSMWHYGFTPIVFFVHQFCVALLENTGLALKTRELLPRKKDLNEKIGWSFEPIKPTLKFSLTIAFTASVWVFVTQTDKLVLSGILSLEDYGYFTLAVLVANGIIVIGGPISSAIMPRMARLHAENKHTEMIKVYRKATKLVSIIAGTTAITLIATAKPLLIAWTGDEYLASQAAPILRLYAAGNLFLSISAFSYYIQYAKGNLRYHLIGNLGLVVILIPCVILAAVNFGSLGAGYVWLSMNALFFLCWVAYVHHKLEPNLHLKWLISDVLKLIFPIMLFATFISLCAPKYSLSSRLENLLFVIIFGCLLFGGPVAIYARFKILLKRNRNSCGKKSR
ncbi:polysaccharide biosynthesis protein [Corallincola holothuriorum]|uniref:Polysaccharide biosynthesis protein n=1 Tax=Corallincola holothuriorum TaxID=2282215 RepID=A0A368MYH3_9GAMM|nr:oligosaccharide flippase family protein [Corallincola holothuriorum]RCU43297.1 polysaccharide biosynthesis protein [Corallincola holothuriorum]